MDAFPYNIGADADKSRLKIIRTVTAPSQSSGRARKRDGQQMTTNRQDPDALLTREQTAAALTACGFPIKRRRSQLRHRAGAVRRINCLGHVSSIAGGMR